MSLPARNPASFLIENGVLRPETRREFLKRESYSVSIERGTVRFEMLAPEPKYVWVAQAVKAAYEFGFVNDDGVEQRFWRCSGPNACGRFC